MTLSDGTKVPARTYYYLLDWNDADNKVAISNMFGKQRLADLTINEYRLLWSYATQDDLANIA